MATRTVQVKLKRDHLEKLCTSRSPQAAVFELIWNGFDADAEFVSVRFNYNALGGLDRIVVADNGHGIPHQEAGDAFENLGGSWKNGKPLSRAKGRILHGKLGKGRFHAFVLGTDVEWVTRYRDGEKVKEYRIWGQWSDPTRFKISEPTDVNESPGTEVRITNVQVTSAAVDGDRCVETVTQEYALYLRQYREIGLAYGGTQIDPASAELRLDEYQLPAFLLEDGSSISARLDIIEWALPNRRALFLCDENGFALMEKSPGIHAPGYSFTAYLKSEFLRRLADQNVLALEEIHPDLRKLLDCAKDQLRDHFRKRAAEDAAGLVDEWKEDEIYPYEGEPIGVIESAERQVFDVVAVNVSAYVPDFNDQDKKSKKLAFRLLKQAISSDPPAVQRILREVLNLPQEKQEDLAKLLEKTSLNAIIEAAKVVTDRLDLLKGVEDLVFEHKRILKERKELHRILAENTWIFGEQYNLTVDDQSLTEVLRKHLRLLGRESNDAYVEAVLRDDGSRGIVDLMLSRRVVLPRAEEREHLVIELKRPSQPINDEVLSQVKSYALAVTKDDRFRDTKTRWKFWAVSNDVSEMVKEEANQPNRESGLVTTLLNNSVEIWVRTWGQIINDCQGRLDFFKRALEYEADRDSSLAYLREKHNQYLPAVLKVDGEPIPAKRGSRSRR